MEDTKKCFYCGEDATTIDHIIPVSYYYDGRRKNKHLTSEYGKENLVDACKECNCIAGNKIFDDVYKKKDFIQEKLKQKYKKVINMPNWTDEEIEKLGKNLKKEVKIQHLARKWALNRINHPILLFDPQQFNKELREFLKEQF